VVVLGFFVVSVYNGLVKARNEVKNAWSSIDVQLKRRHDLIPNLVETVKGTPPMSAELWMRWSRRGSRRSRLPEAWRNGPR
jgi:hypothetical protein